MNTTTNLTRLTGFLAIAATTVGCAGSKALTAVVESDATAVRERDVDVLLDAAPTRPFRVVAELSAETLESTRSVKLMREAAARAGLDGIYWIECASAGSGACTAKGFVYTAWDSASLPRREPLHTASR